MVIKSYFDGSNKADPSRYEHLTLASLSGRISEWSAFERAWNQILKKHGAAYLHTTDAVSLKGIFSEENGWDREKIDALITDCVVALEGLCSTQQGTLITKVGLRPATIKIQLLDFAKAQAENPDLNSVTDVCATQNLAYCNAWWQFRGGLDLHFDRGEPYYGHIVDRLRNSKHTAEHPLMRRVVAHPPDDMQKVRPLQAADLFAWSVSHSEAASRPWHLRILSIARDDHFIEKQKISDPDLDTLAEITRLKLPRRERLKVP